MRIHNLFIRWLPALLTALVTKLCLAQPSIPVPLMQAIPLPYDQVSFQRDGVELCRYHFGATLRRPFIFPVNGPAGRSLTRMGHPHDPITHSHHNSIWVSHTDVDGISFWDDRGQGRIAHQRIERFEDSAAEALLIVESAWINETNRQTLLRERRCLRVQPLPQGEWLLIMDLELVAPESNITFGKTPFGLVGVRMAKTIGVNDGGGAIRNSEGGTNEKEILWKHARWVDYSGPITPTATEGITLLDHPSNPNHPTGFHVRSDGWMGASLTLDGPRIVKPKEPLKLRYGFYIHTGKASLDTLNRHWEKFAQTTAGMPGLPKK